MIVVGSRALQAVRPDLLLREPQDWDLAGSFDELNDLIRRLGTAVRRVQPLSMTKTAVHCADGVIFDFEIVWSDSAMYDLCQMVEGQWGERGPRKKHISLLGVAVAVPVLDVLYTLKLSHRYLKNSPHFLKTMRGIQRMRSAGAKVFDQDWLKRRERETYTYSHPKLDVKKGDFFRGDGVQYVYDHDAIHVAVAHWYPSAFLFGSRVYDHDVPPKPAYRLYMKDGADVACDKGKFFAVDEQVRLWGVLEEAYVLALERSQIPFRGTVTPRRSFEMALMKVCTSITSGWFREYAWENYDRVLDLYEEEGETWYTDRFWAAVERGEVPPYDDTKGAM